MAQKFGSNIILDIAKVKTEVAKIKKIVVELYNRPIIPKTVVTEVVPKV